MSSFIAQHSSSGLQLLLDVASQWTSYHWMSWSIRKCPVLEQGIQDLRPYILARSPVHVAPVDEYLVVTVSCEGI